MPTVPSMTLTISRIDPIIYCCCLFAGGGWLIWNHPNLYSFRDFNISMFSLLYGISGMAVAMQVRKPWGWCDFWYYSIPHEVVFLSTYRVQLTATRPKLQQRGSLNWLTGKVRLTRSAKKAKKTSKCVFLESLPSLKGISSQDALNCLGHDRWLVNQSLPPSHLHRQDWNRVSVAYNKWRVQ